MGVLRKMLVSFVVVLVLTAAASAADWSNTIAAVVLDGSLYTIEKSGALYRTDLSSGKYVQVGKAEFGRTRMMFAGPQNLFTLETDGSLYRVSPNDGSWKRVGKAGDWKNTTAASFQGTRLFTTESSGTLYGTNPISGAWTTVGKAEFGKTAVLFGTDDSLFSIETDGSLYRINPSSGAWSQVGKAGEWANTIAVATMNGYIYTIESNGAL